jgi:MraZ protein
MYLIGRYYHALEQKGRLSIPASFRKQLGDSAILTLGLEGCLFMFAAPNWQQVALEATKLPFTQKKARDWIRLLANNAKQVEFDPLGRILIPDYLRQYAKLQKHVSIVGSLNRLEIWDQSLYHQYLDELQQHPESIAESIIPSI